MNKAQARAATAKLLAVNPHRSVMEAFMDGAQVTLLGEHIPAPRWTAEALYVAFKDGKEVARTVRPKPPLGKQDEAREKYSPNGRAAEQETPETLAHKAEALRREKLLKGVSTWDRFKDLGVAIVDACQAGESAEERGWAWFVPDTQMNDPRQYPPTAAERHYDVIRRDGYLFKNIPESRLKWGPAQLGNEVAEIIRYRMCNRAEVFANPPGTFQVAHRRVFSKSFT